LGPLPLIVVIASAVVDIAAVVLTSATLLMELAPYGPLGILLVGDVLAVAEAVDWEVVVACGTVVLC
jgi:hypothetical protein